MANGIAQTFNLQIRGSLSFAAKDWFWPVLVLFFLGLLFIWRSYPAAPTPRPQVG